MSLVCIIWHESLCRVENKQWNAVIQLYAHCGWCCHLPYVLKNEYFILRERCSCLKHVQHNMIHAWHMFISNKCQNLKLFFCNSECNEESKNKLREKRVDDVSVACLMSVLMYVLHNLREKRAATCFLWV